MCRPSNPFVFEATLCKYVLSWHESRFFGGSSATYVTARSKFQHSTSSSDTRTCSPSNIPIYPISKEEAVKLAKRKTKRTAKREMMENGVSKSDPLTHPYNGLRNAITRPDWPTKHDDEPKSRNLLPYILRPSEHSDRVIRYNDDVVLIWDKYPKGQVHLLLLPRWYPHRDLHPHDAFEDVKFLQMMRKEAANSLTIAIPMLEEKMRAQMQTDGITADQIDKLIEQRDFTKDFQVGIHAHPSQHELHVHIKSRDMVSRHDYGLRHYQAFNTPFLVPIELYPLPENDIIREVKYQNDNLMKQDFQCWRCGQDFGTDWERMKAHLRVEWPAWIREPLTPIQALKPAT